MSGFIPEEKIVEIKNSADIVDIVSESVLLKKAGVNYKGLCPFHSEKTPSFTVSPEKNIFYCFGCGAGGDSISFLMKHNGMSFPEALNMLASRYGIEIQTAAMTPEQKKRIGEKEGLVELNRQVMDFFTYNLSNAEGSHAARAYLENRGLSGDIIKRFCLGFVPDGWDNLVRLLKSKNIARGLVEKSGMVVRKENGGYYDRFRNRIIFPIFNVGMQVTGFGGRVMDDSDPKYLNSPETPVYHKSRSLYGLNLAKSRCRQTGEVFIVEGYFDVISLFCHGVENVVASLGTALTVDHVRMLKGHASKMTLVYDSDAAGIKAAMRSIPIFVNEGVDARILVLPEGQDPDSFINGFGPEVFLEKAGEALSAVSFLIERSIKQHGLTIDGKVRVITDMAVPVSEVLDGVARSIYIKELAEKTGVDEAAILSKVRDVSSVPRSVNNAEKGPVITFSGNMDRLELRIISMMLQFPVSVPMVRQRDVLSMFKDSRLQSLGLKISGCDASGSSLDISGLMSGIEDSASRDLVASLAMGDEGWNEKGCGKLISQFVSVRGRDDDLLDQKIKTAEDSGDIKLVLKLLGEKQAQADKNQNI